MLDAIKDVVRKSSIHVCIVNCGGCKFTTILVKLMFYC